MCVCARARVCVCVCVHVLYDATAIAFKRDYNSCPEYRLPVPNENYKKYHSRLKCGEKVAKTLHVCFRGGDIAQLVERRTGTPLRQV